MGSLVGVIDAMVDERSLLRHPFYEMWSAGELDTGSLAGYAKEYFQLVKAVPGFMDPIIERAPPGAAGELAANRLEEAGHVEPWVRFAGALGVGEAELRAYGGLPETRRAVDGMRELMGSYEGGACAMYAFERDLPRISRAKLDGLAEFYGLTGRDATEYFELHTEADVRHAEAWRGALRGVVRDGAVLVDPLEHLGVDPVAELRPAQHAGELHARGRRLLPVKRAAGPLADRPRQRREQRAGAPLRPDPHGHEAPVRAQAVGLAHDHAVPCQQAGGPLRRGGHVGQ